MGTTGWATENGDDLTVTVAQWYRQHGRDLPWRREGFTPWGSLVSEIMLQQTPVARVLAPLAEWLERWPDAAALAQASVADVVRAWGRLGYPRRALRLRDAAITIVEHHGGEVPSNIDDLLALPGVGDYTARAIAAFAFGQRVPVV
ncbi:MAG TPA: A/G-specific adenine glycosylase, partial [Terrimesophilobacter sp.]|nr:A/G-specific adenine glycosylase [Terrimesophilobacter sp.]